ncbi:MAG: hypothetical protein B6D59_00190 [Campylobacteraceae bacterium 4484_4]|nr:MAG: hypothetical protein B6D59_00190 [Campylobacteraceae bacterium 4484_4]
MKEEKLIKFIQLLLVITILHTTLFAFKASDIHLPFYFKNEIKVLQSLDIHPMFVTDQTYIRMKQKIDKVQAYFFIRSLEEGKVFVATLKKMLDKAHIPDTFLYMAMVESRFLANAKSKKKAAGLWQMVPKTARKYHLTINSKVDERLDPVKSTKAAIQYLTYLHQRFKKWYLVAIAYNCGESRLAKALKKAGTDKLSVLIDPKKEYLPKETRRYVRKIIITALLAHNKEEILKNVKHPVKSKKTPVLKEVKTKKGDSLPLISKKLNVPVKVLKKYNPHLLKGVVPKGKKRYCIYIPEDKINQKHAICANEPIYLYTVKPGDTLFLISKRFNNRLRALKALNKDLKPDKIFPGTKIAVIGTPSKKKNVKKIVTPKTTSSKESNTTGQHKPHSEKKEQNTTQKQDTVHLPKKDMIAPLEKNGTSEHNGSLKPKQKRR